MINLYLNPLLSNHRLKIKNQVEQLLYCLSLIYYCLPNHHESIGSGNLIFGIIISFFILLECTLVYFLQILSLLHTLDYSPLRKIFIYSCNHELHINQIRVYLEDFGIVLYFPLYLLIKLKIFRNFSILTL